MPRASNSSSTRGSTVPARDSMVPVRREHDRAQAADGKLARERQSRRSAADNNDLSDHEPDVLSARHQLRRVNRRAQATLRLHRVEPKPQIGVGDRVQKHRQRKDVDHLLRQFQIGRDQCTPPPQDWP